MRFFIVFSLLFCEMLFGQLDWASSYAQAFEKAVQQEKGVMIMLSQENCKGCWYMENIVLEDEMMVKQIQKDFIPLYLDIHDDDIHALEFRGTPTIYFLKSSGEIIKRLDGVLNIKELTAALNNIETADHK